MNKGVYEIDDNRCAVISDNGDVRVLSKDDDTVEFSELLKLENELESSINLKKEKEKRIDKLTGWKAIEERVTICLYITAASFLMGFLGAYLANFSAKLISMLISGLICGSIPAIAFTYYIVRDRIEELHEVKWKKEDIKKIESNIERLTKEIDKVKEKISVKKVNDEPVTDKETSKNTNLKYYRVLRNYLEEYLDSNKKEKEANDQYTTKCLRKK